jgi:hypothetical protein
MVWFTNCMNKSSVRCYRRRGFHNVTLRLPHVMLDEWMSARWGNVFERSQYRKYHRIKKCGAFTFIGWDGGMDGLYTEISLKWPLLANNCIQVLHELCKSTWIADTAEANVFFKFNTHEKINTLLAYKEQVRFVWPLDGHEDISGQISLCSHILFTFVFAKHNAANNRPNCHTEMYYPEYLSWLIRTLVNIVECRFRLSVVIWPWTVTLNWVVMVV